VTTPWLPDSRPEDIDQYTGVEFPTAATARGSVTLDDDMPRKPWAERRGPSGKTNAEERAISDAWLARWVAEFAARPPLLSADPRRQWPAWCQALPRAENSGE
jgi:hypothetical protein